jgi:hypothetical protein
MKNVKTFYPHINLKNMLEVRKKNCFIKKAHGLAIKSFYDNITRWQKQ